MNNVEKITDLPEIYRIRIPLQSNALKNLNVYVMKSEGQALIVDTGFRTKECKKALLEGLSILNVNIGTASLFLTHTHTDHIGLAELFSGDGNTIYMGEKEYDYYSYVNAGNYWSEQNKCYVKDGYPEEKLRGILFVNSGKYPGPKSLIQPDILLQDGEEFNLGNVRCRPILVSGHTPGHMCLYLPDEKILFLGDHVLFDITPNIMAWPFMHDSLGRYLQSLSRIGRLDVRTALPAHRDQNGVFLEQRVHEIKRHHLLRLEEIMSILKEAGEKGLTPYEIAGKMEWSFHGKTFDTVSEQQRWFAMGEARAHLFYLLERDRVIVSEREGQNVYTQGKQ